MGTVHGQDFGELSYELLLSSLCNVCSLGRAGLIIEEVEAWRAPSISSIALTSSF